MLIASIQGGGARGLLSFQIVQSMMGQGFKPDIWAGTSVGGLLAICATHGTVPWSDVPSQELVPIMQKIFKPRSKFRRLFSARYDSPISHVKELLALFGINPVAEFGKNLRYNCEPLICAFSLNDHKPKFFDKTDEYSVLDVAMATISAPTYFPTYKNWVDGGVVANDPGIAALCYVRKHYKLSEYMQTRLVSIANGSSRGSGISQDGGDFDASPLAWARELPSILVGGNMSYTHYILQALLGKKYLRTAPVLECEMDDVESVLDWLEHNQIEVTNIAWAAMQWCKSFEKPKEEPQL
jgi:hypothetical protein